MTGENIAENPAIPRGINLDKPSAINPSRTPSPVGVMTERQPATKEKIKIPQNVNNCSGFKGYIAEILK